MLDYQRIVDDFRGTLYVTGDGVAFLKAAADEYAAACEEANQRLRLCGERLRQGLRSEAIQLCEIEPNLLDVVAILDFPEREQWKGAAGRFGVAPPPRLLVEVAAELNEAYAIEQPLTALLQQHRLKALARSPLRQRIGILRQLAEVDGRNAVWQEDLLLFERERIKQVHQEGHEAAGQSDLPRLSSLLDELHSGPWLELPPPVLVQWMTNARNRLYLQRALADLERVEVELNAAFSAKDIEAGRRLRECWHAGLAVCGGDASPRMVERARPALAWLTDEDHRQRELADHRAAAATLEKALDDGLPLVKLEPYHQAARRHGYSLMPQLAERYKARVSKLELASVRRKRWLVSSVAASVVLVGVIVITVIVGRVRAHAVETAATSLNKLLDEQRLWDAQEYFANLEKTSPRVAKAVELQDAVVRLQGMLKQETDREAAFAKELGMVKMSMPDPDPVAWARTRELAKTEEDKRSVLKLQTVIAEHKRQVQEAADQRLNKELEQLIQRIEKLSKGKDAALGVQEAAVARLRSDLRALESSSKDASDAARGQLASVGFRLTAIESALEQWRREEAGERAITQAVGDRIRFGAELTRYTRDFPGSNRTKDLTRTLDEAPLWEDIDAGNEAVRRWQEMQRRGPDAQSVSEVLALVHGLLDRRGNSPHAEPFRSRVPYLEALGRRLEAGGPIQARLRDLFTDPLMVGVWMLVHTDGRRYYVKEQPARLSEDIGTFRYIAGFDFKEVGGLATRGDIVYSGPAPQVELAGAVKVTLATMNADNWDKSICSIVQAIYNDKAERPLDPILKATLLQKTLELGCQGSPSLQRAFGPHLEVLKRINGGEAANWLDPRNAAARGARLRVEADLASLPDIAAAVKLAGEDSAAMRACPARFYRWIGWLCRSRQGGWTCAMVSELKNSGRLCVVHRATSSEKVVVGTIGKIDNGTVTIAPNDASAMVEGRPVYVDVPESGTKP